MFRKLTQSLGALAKMFMVGMLLFSGIGFLDARSPAKELATLDERIAFAQHSFEDVYYELVKQGFFDAYYNNNLVVHAKIDENFAQEGGVLLYLIDWLDKRNDRDSLYLLKKLNKYLYLEFYQTLCSLDAQKNQNGKLLRIYKGIFKSKSGTTSGAIAPYRAELSKLITLISMFNLTKQSYEKKREAMAYALHKIENHFLAINTSLVEKSVSDEDIKDFIQILQTHVTREPIIKPSIVKGFLAFSIIAAGLTTAAWFGADYLNEQVPVENPAEGQPAEQKRIAKEWKALLAWFKDRGNEVADLTITPIAKKLSSEIAGALIAKATQRGENGKNLIAQELVAPIADQIQGKIISFPKQAGSAFFGWTEGLVRGVVEKISGGRVQPPPAIPHL